MARPVLDYVADPDFRLPKLQVSVKQHNPKVHLETGELYYRYSFKDPFTNKYVYRHQSDFWGLVERLFQYLEKNYNVPRKFVKVNVD